MALGDQIKKERLKKKISVKDLAKASHISISHLYQIERGEKSPSISTTEDIAKALGIPTYILLESKPMYANFNDDIDVGKLKKDVNLLENIFEIINYLGYDPKYLDENSYREIESKILDYTDHILFKLYKE